MEVLFNNPDNLYFLIFIPLIVIGHYAVLRLTKKHAIPFANFETLSRISRKYLFIENSYILVFRILILIFIVFAMAEMYVVFPSAETTPHTLFLVDAANRPGSENTLSLSENILTEYYSYHNPMALMGVYTFSTYTQIVKQPQVIGSVSELPNLEAHAARGTDVGSALFNGIQGLSSLKGSKRIVFITPGLGSVGTPIPSGIQEALDQNIWVDVVIIPQEDVVGETVTQRSLSEVADITGGIVTRDELFVPEIVRSLLQHKSNVLVLELQLYLLMGAIILLTLEWLLARSIFKTIPFDN
ncbi:MAG: BatA domain-containing protein [Candidatus Woesearchaeota archaeon]